MFFSSYTWFMAIDEKHEHLLGRIKQKILEVYPDSIAIYVFGSFGTKYERKDSDVDIAILPNASIDSVKLWYFAQEIATEIDRDVDLIDLLEASTVFRYLIITTGKRIYCSDQNECGRIESVYRSMYLRFKEDRQYG